MEMENIEATFAGYECVQVTNGELSLWITTSVGPRIIGMTIGQSGNLMAVLPDATAVTPAGKRYHFRGGHRLWHGPEDPERSYVPDDGPVRVTSNHSHCLTFTQTTEGLTGIQKRLTVTLPDAPATVLLDHTLTNHGNNRVELAPWAITQVKPGGFGILPMSRSDTGLLPNRRLSLWPYTRINSPHIQWGDRYLFVHANMSQDEKLKIGWANPAGWLGYWTDEILFVKRAAYQQDADYIDYGSSSECYCDARFLELESLGPRTTLAPGQSTTHQETWQLYSGVKLTAEEQVVANWMEQLGIET